MCICTDIQNLFNEIKSIKEELGKITDILEGVNPPPVEDDDSPQVPDDPITGDLILTNVHYNPERVINGVELGNITLTNVSGLTIINSKTGQIRGNNCQNITIYNNKIAGGVLFHSNNKDLEISRNEIIGGTNGIAVFGCDYLNASDNIINLVKSDSMKFGVISNFIISRNIGSITIESEEGAHPDFCQIQGPMRDGEFSYNVHCPAGKALSQGLFGGQEDSTLHNVKVHHNFFYGHSLNQLSLTSGDTDTVIENNTVLSPVLTSNKGLSRISVPGATSRNNIHSNRAGLEGPFTGGIAIQVTDANRDYYGPDLIKGILNEDGTQPDQLEWWNLMFDPSLKGFGADQTLLPLLPN